MVRTIKSKLLATAVFVSTFSIFALRVVHAVAIPDPIGKDFLTIFNDVTGLIKPITVLTFLATFFYGGYTWMTAGDSEDAVKKAGKILTTSIIGLIIIFLAPSLAELVASLLGVRQIIEFPN